MNASDSLYWGQYVSSGRSGTPPNFEPPTATAIVGAGCILIDGRVRLSNSSARFSRPTSTSRDLKCSRDSAIGSRSPQLDQTLLCGNHLSCADLVNAESRRLGVASLDSGGNALAGIPRNLYAFAVGLEIPPVDTGPSP